MVEATNSIGSLNLLPAPASDIANPISENEIIDEERRRDDSEIQLGSESDIQMVDR